MEVVVEFPVFFDFPKRPTRVPAPRGIQRDHTSRRVSAYGLLPASDSVIQNDLRVVYTPYCVMIHYESETKPVIAHTREVRYMRTTWADVIARDPYYNSNLTRHAEDCSLRQD